LLDFVLAGWLFDGLSAGLLFCFWWCFGAAEKKVKRRLKKRLTGWIGVFRKRSTNDGGDALPTMVFQSLAFGPGGWSA